MNLENYKAIPGHEQYLVSEEGVVVSLKNNTEKVLKQIIDATGFAGVNLYENGERKRYNTYQLVQMAFPNTYTNAGVIWSKKDNKWHCKIISKGKQINLGRYDDEIKASKIYQFAKKNIDLYFTNPARFITQITNLQIYGL